MVDENSALGGQIWRAGAFKEDHADEASKWHARLKAASVTVLGGRRVLHQPKTGVLLAEGPDDARELTYQNLVLATGARERFLPFPGWTLPNVMGAGGLQAMVKSGLPIRGKRVVVSGTGPLLLAVAAYLRRHGAEIALICEQVSSSKLASFGMALMRHPGKIAQGLQLKKELTGIPFKTNCWVVAAHGGRALEGVSISHAGQTGTIKCDYLACGFHLVPNTELPILLGCRTAGGYVQVNQFQQTTVEGIFCAGEPTGIGGIELSLIEGEIAGLAAAGHNSDARALFRFREKFRSFARALEKAFCLRPELRGLASPKTLVCRCEDVPYSRLQEHTSWRGAKLHTRCGMGPCQGRICGPATQFLFKWNPDSVRPPVFPARVETLAAPSPQPQPTPARTGGLQ